jgi:hypothetical protein
LAQRVFSPRSGACLGNSQGDFRPEIKQMFAGVEQIGFLEPLLAYPEWKVDLPPRGYPSQNDLFVLAKGKNGLVSIMVEGKVVEDYRAFLGLFGSDSVQPGKLYFLDELLGIQLFSGWAIGDSSYLQA